MSMSTFDHDSLWGANLALLVRVGANPSFAEDDVLDVLQATFFDIRDMAVDTFNILRSGGVLRFGVSDEQSARVLEHQLTALGLLVSTHEVSIENRFPRYLAPKDQFRAAPWVVRVAPSTDGDFDFDAAQIAPLLTNAQFEQLRRIGHGHSATFVIDDLERACALAERLRSFGYTAEVSGD
jgi:hypothetical protein